MQKSIAEKEKEETTLWDAFKKWHIALGEYWEEKYKPLNLDADYMLDLVCATDPNIWEGECSADPDVYEKLKKFTNKTGKTKLKTTQAYKEIKEALGKIFNYSPEYVEIYKKAQAEITFEKWSSADKRN